jgi:hypothetical protein
MDDLSALTQLNASHEAFLSWLLLDAVAPGAGAPPAGADPSSPLARIVRALLVDAFSRGAAEPKFSETLSRAGVPAPAISMLSAALFGPARAAAVAAARARLAVDAGGGVTQLESFDWAAKAVLASSSVAVGARDALLALSLVTRDASGGSRLTSLELSREDLAAVIASLESAADAAAATVTAVQ